MGRVRQRSALQCKSVPSSWMLSSRSSQRERTRSRRRLSAHIWRAWRACPASTSMHSSSSGTSRRAESVRGSSSPSSSSTSRSSSLSPSPTSSRSARPRRSARRRPTRSSRSSTGLAPTPSSGCSASRASHWLTTWRDGSASWATRALPSSQTWQSPSTAARRRQRWMRTFRARVERSRSGPSSLMRSWSSSRGPVRTSSRRRSACVARPAPTRPRAGSP
mmetsp:Transcript_632/g.1530  ORF Transcript_632/g.1530 Transcript_632/m.1530 type:complete len:220 (+) Transcript_632:564-1223(+)